MSSTLISFLYVCRYNKAQISARNVVERMFGVLKARFPCLGSLLRLRLHNVAPVIIACAVLHNIAIEAADAHFPETTYAGRALIGNEPLPDDVVGNRYRDNIVNTHFN
jgi:DDE superfamily endonuclease